MRYTWNSDGSRGNQETTREDAFMLDLIGVCRKHNMSLAHEDTGGGFIIEVPLSERTVEWMQQAMVYRRRSI